MPEELPYHETDRDKLGTQLEHANRNMGLKTDHFVDSKSLCASCRWAFIARRESKNNRIIYCSGGYPGGMVPDDITECNSYANITELSLMQMAGIAYLIGDKERKVGFYAEEKDETK